MTKLAELIEQRGAIVTRMNDAHAKDEGEAFTTAEGELRALDSKITRARALDAADRADPGTPMGGRHDTNLSDELRSKFSMTRLLAHAAGMDVDAGFELEVQAELAKRAGAPAKGFYIPTEIFEQRVQLTTNSGVVVPTTFRDDLFTTALVNESVVNRLGATTLSGLTGDVVIPREPIVRRPAG